MQTLLRYIAFIGNITLKVEIWPTIIIIVEKGTNSQNLLVAQKLLKIDMINIAYTLKWCSRKIQP